MLEEIKTNIMEEDDRLEPFIYSQENKTVKNRLRKAHEHLLTAINYIKAAQYKLAELEEESLYGKQKTPKK